MKFSVQCIIALSLGTTVDAVITPPTPCEEGNPPSHCVPAGATCNGTDKLCCDQTHGCFGYPFFKRCQPVPECTPQWYDCSDVEDCCGDFVCIVDTHGNQVCDKETITTKTVELTDVPTQSPTLPEEIGVTDPPVSSPTSAPTKKITKDPDNPVTFTRACSTGDPHINTFDGLSYDCQGNGEHYLLKSTVSDRKIVGRFQQMLVNKWTSTRAVAIQDEGHMPIVQVNIPMTEEGVSHEMGNSGCRIQLFVDGVQKDINGYSHDENKVEITTSGDNNRMYVKYPESEFQVTLTMGFWKSCMLHVCVDLPTTDTVVGLMGTNDGDPSNDWTNTDGTVTPIPDTNLLGFPGYEWCTTNYCIRDEVESIFTYNEPGLDFEDFQLCDMPADFWAPEYIEDRITPEMEILCNGDFACAMDAALTDFETARLAKVARETGLQDTCSMGGGECVNTDCCDGFVCSNPGGFADKKCVPIADPAPTCVGERAECGAGTPCCDDMICVDRVNGKAYCSVPAPDCLSPGGSCTVSDDCCGGTLCLGADGEKKCVDVAIVGGVTKLPEGECCGYAGSLDCLDGSRCIADAYSGFNQRCRELPTCWAKPWRPCDPNANYPDCCADSGNACQEHRGRMLCKPLPVCAAQWHSCDHVACCDTPDGESPLTCMAHPTLATKKICYPDASIFKFDVESDVSYSGSSINGAVEEYGDDITLAAAAEKCAKKCLDTTGCVAFTTKESANSHTCAPKSAQGQPSAQTVGFYVSGKLKTN